MRLLARLLVAITLAFAPLLPTVRAAAPAPPPPATYQALIAQAQALAQEKSWGRAEMLYAQALAVAPDAEARRWCELWQEEARSQTAQDYETYHEEWKKGHLSAYDRFEESYRTGKPRDEFWIALLTSRADFENRCMEREAAWSHYAAVADELASQRPGPEAAKQYISFLQRIVSSQTNRSELPQSELPNEFLSLRSHFTNGAKIGVSAEDRAWCAWQLARIEEKGELAGENAREYGREMADRWAAALAATTGTRWEAQARAEEFIWRVLSSRSPDLPDNSPADLPAIMSELERVKAALNKDTDARLSGLLEGIGFNLRQPQLRVRCSRQFQPNTPIRFSYGTSGVAQLTITLDRVSPATWLAYAANDVPRYQQLDFPEPHDRPAGAELVREWQIDLPDPKLLEWRSDVVEAAPRLAPGYYVLTVRGEPTRDQKPVGAQKCVIVSGLDGYLVASAASEGYLFVYRHSDRSPVARATVHAADLVS